MKNQQINVVLVVCFMAKILIMLVIIHVIAESLLQWFAYLSEFIVVSHIITFCQCFFFLLYSLMPWTRPVRRYG